MSAAVGPPARPPQPRSLRNIRNATVFANDEAAAETATFALQRPTWSVLVSSSPTETNNALRRGLDRRRDVLAEPDVTLRLDISYRLYDGHPLWQTKLTAQRSDAAEHGQSFQNDASRTEVRQVRMQRSGQGIPSRPRARPPGPNPPSRRLGTCQR